MALLTKSAGLNPDFLVVGAAGGAVGAAGVVVGAAEAVPYIGTTLVFPDTLGFGVGELSPYIGTTGLSAKAKS
jgi:hypothetical protein